MLTGDQPLLLNVNGTSLDCRILGIDSKILAHGEDKKEGERNGPVSFGGLPQGMYLLQTSLDGLLQTFRIQKL